jgi:ribose transport system substrate-binding protein
LACLASVVLLAVVAGCGSSDSSSSGSTGTATGSQGDKQFVLGISNPIGSNPTLKYWQQAIETQAKALGMKTVAVDANFDPNKQLSDVRTLADQGVDAIVVHPLNPDAIRPAVEDAASKGIKVIGYDGGDGPYSTNFEEQGYQGAKDAALALSKKLSPGAKIAVIEGVPQVPILAERNKGFADGAKEAGLEIVAKEVNLKDSADGAQPLVEAWKSKYGDQLAGILA